jgi:uncharacterized membrane protein
LEQLEALSGGLVDSPWVRSFVGTPATGYKIGLCQRCAAIYGTIALAGLLYGLLRRWRRIPPMPLWAYGLFGVVPMGLDGGLQLLSYLATSVFPRLPIEPHETTPLMRLITGAMFGLATVWLAYPHLDETMAELRAQHGR